MRRVPSLERIRETVGWEPQTSLDEALEAITDSIRRNPRESRHG